MNSLLVINGSSLTGLLLFKAPTLPFRNKGGAVHAYYHLHSTQLSIPPGSHFQEEAEISAAPHEAL